MKIRSGTTDQVAYFVAIDDSDGTRKTGLSSFTVHRSRNGSAEVAMSSPTVTEMSAANMPGVYTLLLDEDMTIGTGNSTEQMVFHIAASGMEDVTIGIELYLDQDLATVDGIVTAIKAKTDNLPTDPADQSLIIAATDNIISAIGALNDLAAADILEVTLTESYAAKGAEGNIIQILYAILQRLSESVQSGTGISVKGLNGTTEKMTFTLDDADAPKSITRAS